MVYVVICATWIFPILIHLPRIFEPGVTFGPGKNHSAEENPSEVGYLCYSYEDRRRVLSSTTNYVFNLANDTIVLIIVLISSIISIWGFNRQVLEMRDKLSKDELKLFRYNFIAALKQKKLSITIFSICLSYFVLRLPLVIIGNTTISHITFGFAFCVFLYNLQFCVHFMIYAVGGKHFAEAYYDMLKLIFPCCSGNPSTDTNQIDVENMRASYIIK